MTTLSQLLALPELDLRLVQSGVGDPELSWASTTELLDLGAYLEGGEIVLTTGLALSADDPRWRDFVASLSRARVAAIGFGVGVNHARIPAPLLAAASTYRVALVEIQPPIPFIAVSKAVAGLLHADEVRAAQRALQIHQRLLDGGRSPRSSAEILSSIAQATGRRLALLAPDGGRIASTAGFSETREPGLGDEVLPLDESGFRLVIQAGEPLRPEARAVIAAGAMILGLEQRGERNSEERERERWERLTEGLMRGELGAASASMLDPSLVLPDRVRAVAVQGAAEDLAVWRRMPRAGLDRLVTGIVEQGSAAGVARTWMLCPADEEPLARALAVIGGHGLDAVVGRAVELPDAPLSRRSAAAKLGGLSAVAQLYMEPREPAVIRADHGSPLLEALLGAPERSRGGEQDPSSASSPSALVRAVLGGLSREQATDPEVRHLRETLRVLLSHNGHRGPTATELGIHRNTLRDRISRIERLTGRAVDNPDDRAEFWLALRLEDTSR